MTKLEFLNELERQLSGLSQAEVNKTTSYYSEIISDKTEDGMTEEEAVASLGNISEIAHQAFLDAPVSQVIKSKIKKPVPVWVIILLILGFPLWFGILIAFLSVIFSVYIAVWSIIFALWAAAIGIIIGGVAASIGSAFLFTTNTAAGLFALGAGVFCIGLGILLIFPVLTLSKLLVKFTVWFAKKIKGLIVGRRVEAK